MSIITTGIDDESYPYDDYWYESELDWFVEDAATRGIEIQTERTGTNRKGEAMYGPAIAFSGFWSQGDGLAFDAKIDWPKFFETHPDFASTESLTPWFLLLSANPDYVSATVRRNGHNCMSADVDCDWPDVAEHGYFAGMHIEDEMPELLARPLEQYLKEVCEDEAHKMYRTLESCYEGECEHLKEQRVEDLIEEHRDDLRIIVAALLLLGPEFHASRVETAYPAEDMDIDMQDLDNLGLIGHITGGSWRVAKKGLELLK